jgi:hypothetical protein
MDNPLTEFLSVPTLSVNFTHSITLRFSLSETFELPTLLSSFKGLMGPCETPFLSNLPVPVEDRNGWHKLPPSIAAGQQHRPFQRRHGEEPPR